MEQPVTGSSAHLALDAWLVEYKCLRSEIEWLIDGGAKYQNLAVTLMGLIFTAIAWIVKEAPVLLVPTLLVAPFLFTLLGFLYCRQHEEVYVVAAYLKDYVRPRVRCLVNDDAIWGWEEFKAKHAEHWSMVFALRAMLFVAPSIGSIIAVLAYAFSQRLISFHLLRHFVPAVFVAWFCFNV